MLRNETESGCETKMRALTMKSIASRLNNCVSLKRYAMLHRTTHCSASVITVKCDKVSMRAMEVCLERSFVKVAAIRSLWRRDKTKRKRKKKNNNNNNKTKKMTTTMTTMMMDKRQQQ